MPDALDVGLTDLCEELRFNSAVERGEIEVEQPREPGVYSVGEDGAEEYWGSQDEVSEEMLAALAQAVIDADSANDTDYYGDE